MRAQCSGCLAGFTHVDVAGGYLNDARLVLDHFEEGGLDEATLSKVKALRATLDETEQDLQYRREHPSEEDDYEEEAEGKAAAVEDEDEASAAETKTLLGDRVDKAEHKPKMLYRQPTVEDDVEDQSQTTIAAGETSQTPARSSPSKRSPSPPSNEEARLKRR